MFRKISILIVLVICAFTVPAIADTAAQQSGSPEIRVLRSLYKFPDAMEGDVLTHEFVVLNNGTAPLYIQKVKTSCSCTAASYTQDIAPGGEGRVVLKLDTAGFGGKDIAKPVTIISNDPKHPRVQALMTGYVDRFAKVTPRVLRMVGPKNGTMKGEIVIKREKDYPFQIIRTYADRELEGKLTHSIERTKDGFLLKAEAVNPPDVRIYAKIHLVTDSPIQREIAIPVYMRAQ